MFENSATLSRPGNSNLRGKKLTLGPKLHKSTVNQSELMGDSSYEYSYRNHDQNMLPEPSINLISSPLNIPAPKTTRNAMKVRRNIKIYGSNMNPKASKSNNSRKITTVHNSSI